MRDATEVNEKRTVRPLHEMRLCNCEFLVPDEGYGILLIV